MKSYSENETPNFTKVNRNVDMFMKLISYCVKEIFYSAHLIKYFNNNTMIY